MVFSTIPMVTKVKKKTNFEETYRIFQLSWYTGGKGKKPYGKFSIISMYKLNFVSLSLVFGESWSRFSDKIVYVLSFASGL